MRRILAIQCECIFEYGSQRIALKAEERIRKRAAAAAASGKRLPLNDENEFIIEDDDFQMYPDDFSDEDDDSDAVPAHPLSLPQVLSSMRGYLENESDVIKSGKSKLSETFMYDCYFSFQFTHV